MKRSYQAELLDADTIPLDELHQNLKELEIINRLLGGHQLNILALKKILNSIPPKQTLSIIELGSGGGDNLRELANWCKSHSISAQFIGIDLKDDCITYAQEKSKNYPNISFVQSDYKKYQLKAKADIIFSSLFCHHLNEEQLDEYLIWNELNSRFYFINDLHRHPLAKGSIWFLTRLFSKSRLVKNDAPLSVHRGFIKSDWIQLFKRKGLEFRSLEWKWAFRWMIIGKGKADV